MKTVVPTKITLQKARDALQLNYGDEASYSLNAELLRVCSPSAEVQGHGPGQKRVPLDKQDVLISNVEAQGNYALRLIFSDGHDSGIYSWAFLHELCLHSERYWQQYLQDAEQERARQAGTSTVKWIQP